MLSRMYLSSNCIPSYHCHPFQFSGFSLYSAFFDRPGHWQHWHTLATLALSGGFSPQQPPTCSRPQQPPQQPPHSSRPSSRPTAAAPAAAHSSRPSSRPSSRLSIFSLISRPFYPPTAARGGFRGILSHYAPFQSFPSYLDRSRAFGSMGALSRRHYWLYGGLWGV